MVLVYTTLLNTRFVLARVGKTISNNFPNVDKPAFNSEKILIESCKILLGEGAEILDYGSLLQKRILTRAWPILTIAIERPLFIEPPLGFGAITTMKKTFVEIFPVDPHI